MSDSFIQSSPASPSSSVGEYNGSVSSTADTNEVSPSSQQVISGNSLTVDSSLTDAIQEGYNNSYVSLPEALESAGNEEIVSTQLAPVAQDTVEYLGSTISNDIVQNILDNIQVYLEEQEVLYEQHYAPGAPQPAINNDSVIREQSITVLNTMTAVNNLALSSTAPVTVSEDGLSLTPEERVAGLPGPRPPTIPISNYAMGTINIALLSSLTGQSKLNALLAQMATRNIQNQIYQYEEQDVQRGEEAKNNSSTTSISSVESTDDVVTTDPETPPPEYVYVSQDTTSQTTYFNNITRGDNLLSSMQAILRAANQAIIQQAGNQARNSADNIREGLSASKGIEQSAKIKALADNLLLKEQLQPPIDTLVKLITPPPATPINASLY